METIEAKKITTTEETLAKIYLSPQPADDSQKILKPSSDEAKDDDDSKKSLKPRSDEAQDDDLVKGSGTREEVLNGEMESGGYGVSAVVITKTVVIEETEVREDGRQMRLVIEKNLEEDEVMGGCGGGEDIEEGAEDSVSGAINIEGNAVQENQKDNEEMGGSKGEQEAKEGFEYSLSRPQKIEGNDLQENGKKGDSSHLFGDGSEAMNMNCSGDGISLVVDVKGCLASENGSEVKSVFEDDKCSLADDHRGNAGGELMEVDACLLEDKTKKQENGAEIFIPEEDMGKQNDGVNVGEKSTEIDVSLSKVEMGQQETKGYLENSKEIEQLDNQVSEQEKGEHSEKSTKIEDSGNKMGKQENVGNTGDESIEIEEEEEGKDQFDREDDESEEDHDFVVGDFVWGKIKSHPWWPGQIYDPLDASDYAAKVKHKGQLLVAYFGDGSFSWCSPSQLKSFVDNFEEMSKQSNSKNFVNAVQKSLDEVSRLVQAEFTCKCNFEDKIVNASPVNAGIKAGVPVPKGNTVKLLINQMEPPELFSSMEVAAAVLSASNMLELTVMKSWLIAFHRRRGCYRLPEYHEPKSIEGLEGDTRTAITGNCDINGPSEDLEKFGENADDKLYQQRKQKSVAELLGEEIGVEDEAKQKKGKMTKDVASGKNLSSGMKRSRKREEMVSVSPETDNENGGVEEETTKSFVSRQRKKSKYLSPPYTSPTWGGKGSAFLNELVTESEKVSEITAMQLDDSSPPVKRSSGKKSQGRKRLQEGSVLKEHQKIIDAATNVAEVLHELLCTALNPSWLGDKKKYLKITGFISAFRNSSFVDGSTEEMYNAMPERKRKQRNGEEKLDTEESPVTLVISFPPAMSLPTKSDLLNVYSKFGELIEKETEILYNCSCAHVVFAGSSNAEEALNMSMEKKLFGGGNVRYELRYPSADPGNVASAVKRPSEEALTAEPSALAFIKQKLEMMSAMVKNCESGNMTAETKASLESGMKELLDKVSEMGCVSNA